MASAIQDFKLPVGAGTLGHSLGGTLRLSKSERNTGGRPERSGLFGRSNAPRGTGTERRTAVVTMAGLAG